MKFYVVIAAALILAPLSALAAEDATGAAAGQGGAKRWAACSTEIQKFCANIEHGKGKIRSCLEGHTADLSDGCKARMAEHASKPN